MTVPTYHHYECPQYLDETGNCNYCIQCPTKDPHEAHKHYTRKDTYLPCPGIRTPDRRHHPDCTDNTGLCLCKHCGNTKPHPPHTRPGPAFGWIEHLGYEAAQSGCAGTPLPPLYELTWWSNDEKKEHHQLSPETVAFFGYLKANSLTDANLNECPEDCSYRAVTEAQKRTTSKPPSTT